MLNIQKGLIHELQKSKNDILIRLTDANLDICRVRFLQGQFEFITECEQIVDQVFKQYADKEFSDV